MNLDHSLDDFFLLGNFGVFGLLCSQRWDICLLMFLLSNDWWFVHWILLGNRLYRFSCFFAFIIFRYIFLSRWRILCLLLDLLLLFFGTINRFSGWKGLSSWLLLLCFIFFRNLNSLFCFLLSFIDISWFISFFDRNLLDSLIGFNFCSVICLNFCCVIWLCSIYLNCCCFINLSHRRLICLDLYSLIRFNWNVLNGCCLIHLN